MSDYQYIYYKLFNGGQLEEPWAIKRAVNDPKLTNVLDLLDLIHTKEQLKCRPRDLKLYEKGTTIEDYESKASLKISHPLSALEDTSEDDALLVVIPPSLQPPLSSSNTLAQFSESTRHGIELMAQDFLTRNKTITISNATKNRTNFLMSEMGLPERGATWQNKPDQFPHIVDGFNWPDGDEDSRVNRDAYMAYLKRMLQLPPEYALADAQPNRDLLNVQELAGIVGLRGSTDVVITKVENVENETLRNNMEAVLELKIPSHMSQKDHSPQIICEHFAASYLNPKHPLVSVLTDLNGNWIFFWFAFDNADDSDDSGIALYKLRLCGKEAATEAKFLLDNLFDNSAANNLPCTFAKRQPFQAILKCITQERKRRREFGGDDTDSHDQDSKPPRSSGADKSAANHPGADSSLSQIGRMPQNNRSSECGESETNRMNTFDSLSLLAPGTSRDVGNELDLLDMVDKSEQYEIIHSFTAKHIVPFMRGSAV